MIYIAEIRSLDTDEFVDTLRLNATGYHSARRLVEKAMAEDDYLKHSRCYLSVLYRDYRNPS